MFEIRKNDIYDDKFYAKPYLNTKSKYSKYNLTVFYKNYFQK